jgi:hypothetical protein
MEPTGICVRVVLGMGQIDCDIASNLYRHHRYIVFDLVVAREVVGRWMCSNSLATLQTHSGW